jgi:hypothetical protein
MRFFFTQMSMTGFMLTYVRTLSVVICDVIQFRIRKVDVHFVILQYCWPRNANISIKLKLNIKLLPKSYQKCS